MTTSPPISTEKKFAKQKLQCRQIEVDGEINLASDVETETGTSLTLSSSYHNKIVDFTNASGCTVTVPDGLSSGVTNLPFSCSLSKGEGAGDVTVEAGVGAEVNAPGGLLVMDEEFGLMTLREWPDGTFRLYGGTA